MRSLSFSLTRFFRAATLLFVVGALLQTASAQQKPAETPPQPQTDDVIRINTDLIQTDVTVLDKQGRFVDDLRREQFELLIDGKPQPITFFERVMAGSTSEETQIAAARGTSVSNEGLRPLDRGRTIYFFVDDLHMEIDSLVRARKTITEFVENRMGQNDQVAIASTSGRVGFLQQLTDDKVVLRAAIKRLTSSSQLMLDSELPPMPEMMAMAIDVYHDAAVLDYYVQPLLTRGTPRLPAEEVVKGRAKRILRQSAFLTRTTLATLESLTRSSAELPGRKLVFFISDGFMLNSNESDIMDRLRNITNAAARSGVVLYALNARGLAVVGAGDVMNNLESSASPQGNNEGIILSYATRELSAVQESLRVLAGNTGGRAFVNTNSLTNSLATAIKETSVYYLVAWRPESATQSKDKFRQIEVRVVGRPDLNVQVRRGYYDMAAAPPAVVKTEKKETKQRAVSPKKTQDDLNRAIASPYPTNALPTQLGLLYVDTPDKGPVLTASIQVARQFMTFNHSEDKQTTLLDLAGIVLNDQGKPVSSFSDRLNLAVYFPQYVGQPRHDPVYNFQAQLAPGLYQVRVATRDVKSGRVGSAMQWIEIPNLAAHKLSMSSLIVGEITREAEKLKNGAQALAESRLSADHRLDRTSRLRFMTYVYNAARGTNGAGAPDVVIQLQILREGQPVVTTALRKVEVGGGSDLARLPYAAELPLEALIPGRYALLVTAIDRITKASVSQRTNIEIE